jgi:hypothetical protein
MARRQPMAGRPAAARLPRDDAGAPGPDDRLRVRLVALEAISARHSAHITVMWQAPSLGLAAEAFLLTVALAPTSSTAARVIVSVLGMAVALLAGQFMATHRYVSRQDGAVLADLIDRLDLTEEFRRSAGRVPSTWSSRRSSYRAWRAGLAVFVIANAVILAVSLLDPGVFG